LSSRLKADVALALCSLLWGATFVVVKEALDSASVFVFMVLRFGLAALLMAVAYHAALRQLSHREALAGAEIGVFLFLGYALQNAGLLHTTPSKSAFITGSGVVLVPLLMGLFWKRRIHGWAWAGAVAALCGLYLIVVPAGEGLAGLRQLSRGDLLTFGCAVMFALHIILIGHYTGQHSVRALSLLQVAVTAVLSLAAIPLFAATGWEVPRLAWNTSLVAGVLITAVGATAVAFSVQVWAQQHTTPNHTAILLTLEPVFAAATSYIVLHERLGPRALAGAGLVFAGIFLAEWKGPAQAAVDSPGPVTETSASDPR
jgi:drug/metabolite transporter (DMT)-like permease